MTSEPTFMCIDTLDKCVGTQRLRFLDSLKEVLESSAGARIFVTGRPHIRVEIKKRLPGKVTSVSGNPPEGIRYISSC